MLFNLKEIQMTSSVLKMQVSSLQYSDSAEQQLEDVRTLFTKGKQFPIKVGTEAGLETNSYDHLKEFAKEFNHVIHIRKSNWIAMDRKIIQRGSTKKGSVFVAENDDVFGPGHDSEFATLAFNHADPRMGRISIAGVHYPTRGKTPRDPNHKYTDMYARRVNEWMRVASKRGAISFVGGDFNMHDRKPDQDWAHGGNFTSIADDLEKWQNTGHGPIDGFCSWDYDRRVSAKRWNVLDDSELKMHSDHYIGRATWNVRHLKLK